MMKKIFSTILFFLLSASPVLGEDKIIAPNNPVGPNPIFILIGVFSLIVVFVNFVVFVLFAILGLIKFYRAGKNTEKKSQAKDLLIKALINIIILASFVATMLVLNQYTGLLIELNAIIFIIYDLSCLFLIPWCLSGLLRNKILIYCVVAAYLFIALVVSFISMPVLGFGSF